MDEVTQWLTDIVKGIVSMPEEVKVTNGRDNMGVLFTLYVDPSDAGKIIGRGGKTSDALRTLLYTKGYSHNMRASLTLDVPEIEKDQD